MSHSKNLAQRIHPYHGLLVLISLSTIETFIFLVAFALTKSEASSQFLWGLSLPRLGIAAFLTLIIIIGLVGSRFIFRKEDVTNKIVIAFFYRQNLFRVTLLIFTFLSAGQFILLNFDAESFGRYSEYYNQSTAILWWGFLLCGQITIFLRHFNPLRTSGLTWKNIIYGLLAIAIATVWYVSSQDMAGRPATTWMGYFQVEEFYQSNLSSLGSFLREMRAGIPPLIFLSEIAVGKVTGSTRIITREFYRVALLISYLIAAFIFANKTVKGIISAAIATIFMAATIQISARNPEIYDIYYPCFLLLYILLIRITKSKSHYYLIWAFGAGFFLALAELSRPFVLLLMPFFLVFAILSLRKLPRKALIAFLIPLLLISGGWHLKLLIFNQGQVFWSNHSGFNLYRAWEQVADIPEPPPEPQTWDRRNQIHSQEHYLNSQVIQRVVFEFIVKNPGDAFSYMFERIGVFLEPRTSFFGEPELGGTLINLYRFIFKICLIYWAIQILILGFNLFRKPWRLLFADPQNILLITTTLTVLLLALSEKGEEARLLLATLPMVAALPTYQGPNEMEP